MSELDIICTKILLVLGAISKILHDLGYRYQVLMLTTVEIMWIRNILTCKALRDFHCGIDLGTPNLETTKMSFMSDMT